MSSFSHMLSAGVEYDIGRRLTMGFSGNFEALNFDFDGLGFAALKPWDNVQKTGVGLSVDWRFAEVWSLTIRPSLAYSREEGGDWSDSESYGVVLGFTRKFGRGLILGTGVGVFSGLENTAVYPLPIVIWQISEQWTLGNSFRPGPGGPAGLELVRTLGGQWQAALGTAYRSERFRLDDKGFAPGGIGLASGELLWLRLSRSFGHSLSLDLWGGTVLWGKVAVENPSGHRLTSASVDPGLVAAATMSLRF